MRSWQITVKRKRRKSNGKDSNHILKISTCLWINNHFIWSIPSPPHDLCRYKENTRRYHTEASVGWHLWCFSVVSDLLSSNCVWTQSVSVGFLDRNHTFIGSFFPFMVTGPRYSRLNWGSAFSADCKHLQNVHTISNHSRCTVPGFCILFLLILW